MRHILPKNHRFFWITISIIIVCLILRLALPYAILWYIDQRANKMPDYRLKIEDLDVHLYNGSYTLKNVQLVKLDKKIPTPFLSAKSINFAVQWRALLQGAFVAEIRVDQPIINFVVDPKGDAEQLTIDKRWRSIVEALFPLNFNKIIVNNGSLHYRSFTASPPFDVYLKNMQLEISNMQKVENRQSALSSSCLLTANTLDGGPVSIKILFDPFAKRPTFKLVAEVEKMRISKINNFLQNYTKITVSEGWFSLYMEAESKNGKIQGYAKPFLKDLQIINPKENLTPVQAIYKGAAVVVAKVLQNPSQKTVATRIPIEGSIDSPDTSVWEIIKNLVKHAFFQALLPKIDRNTKPQKSF